MLRLEKIFQNDDNFFIGLLIVLKTFTIFCSIYIFSILEFNSIYQLFDISIFKNSIYSNHSIYFTTIYLLISCLVKKNNQYNIKLIAHLREDILPLFISCVLYFIILIVFKINHNFNLQVLYLSIYMIFNLFLLKIFSNYYYIHLIDNNIIQRNIMLVGTFDDILKISTEQKEKINIYKCCLLITNKNMEITKIRQELKIPVFTQFADIRSILEYHSLGQIWILDNKKNDLNELLNNVFKFSVDIFIIDMISKINLNKDKLINNKYKFIPYEISKFYGYKLLIKILIDKILSIIFLIISFPVILLSSILIYLEDGFPIIFTQDRTGWDGRRFKIYKLRSLKNVKYDTTIQVLKDDKRKLKIGRIIRSLSIDEVPQFYNVLLGDMSIVGPRPHPVNLDIKYATLFNNFLKRHKSSPGLTGWAQVNHSRGATPKLEQMKNRMELDLWYLNNWSIGLDLYIILKTFYIIFKTRGD